MENNIKENTKCYPFVIEYNTNYSVVLKGIRRTLSFEVFRKISNDLSYMYLSDSIKQDLHNTIMHGECMLSNLLELNAYMYDMGKMHNAKLRYACEHISENFKATKHIDIIDYGCGLGIGIISYADFLREKHLQQNVRRIVLIEPSYVALCRAALHARLLFPNAQIITINKKFDELEIDDLYRDSNISVLHIFSNILDIGNYDDSNSYFGYDLTKLATVVRESLKGNNEFLCIAPYYDYKFKDDKIPFFANQLGINIHYEFIREKGEFVYGENWTCAIYVGSINNETETNIYKISNVENKAFVTYENSSIDKQLAHAVLETLSLSQFKERFKVDKIDIVRKSNNELVFSCNGHKGSLSDKIKESIINEQPIKEACFSFVEYNDFIGWVLHEKYESEYNAVDKVDEIIYSGVREIKAKEFLGNTSLKRVVIPNGVTKIGEYAFQDCTSLESIEIPDSVIEIERYTFAKCSKLRHVTLPKHLSKISEGLFWQCSSLEGVVIPDSVAKIRKSAFQECTFLESIEIPDSVIEIERCAFSKCSKLRHVTLPKHLSKISESLFYQCSSLEGLVVPNSVVKIGEGAFYGCTSLESIEISDSVIEIERCAFAKCSKLRHVTLPKYLSKIEVGLFYQCSSLEGLVVPNGVQMIELAAFRKCTSLEGIAIPNSVTDIGRLTFAECSSLRKVVIPDSVAKIREYAFCRCISLESIEIPDSVTVIEKFAFLKCSELKTVVIPNSVTKIGEYAFQKCTSLESIEIPDSVTVIEKYAFSQCPKLKHVVLSKNLSKIESALFWQCTSLESIEILNGVTEIGEGAFQECSSLRQVVLPNSVSKICNQAFWQCSSLESIEIPYGVTKIGEYAFQGCTSLESIEISDSVTEIGEFAFSKCAKLRHITLPKKLLVIADHLFWQCNSLESVLIPNSLENINGSAFKECTSLENIKLPNSIINIEEFAFSYCPKLLNITLPSCLSRIKRAVFWQCSSLERVVIPNSVKDIAGNAFGGCVSLDIDLSQNLHFIVNEGVLLNKDANKIVSFLSSNKIKEYSIPNSIVEIGSGAFSLNPLLEYVKIPEKVKEINSTAFCNVQLIKYLCVSENNQYFSSIDGILYSKDMTILKRVPVAKTLHFYKIPEGITKIEAHAFCGCTAKCIEIPSSVREFESRALNFEKIHELHIEIVDIMKCTIDDEVFDNNDIFETCVLYVPKESLSLYKQHPVFSKFKHCDYDGLPF